MNEQEKSTELSGLSQSYLKWPQEKLKKLKTKKETMVAFSYHQSY